ncbi:Tyrosinase ustQ [Paramyrothecium foliicola]|nr:Tyrosinase ustQ [Paramyrothecium foliicola]
MVKVSPFHVEQWMDEYETTPSVLNAAETCCSSISVEDLRKFDTRDAPPQPVDLSTRLTYGAILGSDELRNNIANLYGDQTSSAPVSPKSVIVMQGAISANNLVLYSLVGPGDHVICVFPTYQQLYSIPESLGAEVSLWKLQEQDAWIPNVSTLKGLIRENTKMIIINNPNNPTGATIPSDTLAEIVRVAKEHDLILFADEVYRPLFHSLPEDQAPPSVISMGYKKVVVTSSMSKAWALAGIRVGWVASPDASIMELIARARDYTTISVSQIDDQIARYALSPEVRPGLISRNLELARTNLNLVDKFVQGHAGLVSWVKPNAGTTAFIQIRSGGQPVDDEKFCKDLIRETKVMLVPGARCFGNGNNFPGYVRIGYVCETDVLEEALAKLVLTFLSLAAAAAATCIPRSNTTCTNPSVRKEWRELTDVEKAEYIRAAVCLRQLPKQKYEWYDAVTTRLDELVHTHNVLNSDIHFVANFLPWHRWFVQLHEDLLRTECGYTGTQPYWDWSIDSDKKDTINSPVFDPVTGFGGNGKRTNSSEPGFQRCVVDGPFANSNLTLGMGWPDDNVDDNRLHCFSREFNGGLGLDENGEQILGDMQASAYGSSVMNTIYGFETYADMSNMLEGLPHAQIHSIIFGDMGPSTSPNEPLFFLHHANVDRAWAKWQGRNATRLADYTGVRYQWDAVPATLDDTMPVIELANSEPVVRDYMDTLAGPLCYTYSSM